MLIRAGVVTDIKANSYDSKCRVYDENHYVVYDSENKKADFYVDGKKKTTIDSEYSPSVSLKGYYIRSYKDKLISLYSIDGEKIYSLGGTSYGDLAGLDVNDNIVVRDPQQETYEKYYIVNKSGEQISGKYSSISIYGEYYSASNMNEKKLDLLDKTGQAIVSGEYTSYELYKDNSIVLGRKNNDSYDYIDMEKKSPKVSFEGYISYSSAGYLKVTGDNTVTYYTESGDEFYKYDRK
jgi:hypothetical protein